MTGRSYDLSLDDQRFLMILRPAQAGEDRTISIVTHWLEELKARARAKQESIRSQLHAHRVE